MSLLNKKDFYWAFAFQTEYLNPKVREILTSAHIILAKKSVEDKAICKKDMFETIKQTYAKNNNIQIRSTDEEIPVGVIILKNRIINLLWADEPAAYEIQNREIVDRYNKYFQELWEEK